MFTKPQIFSDETGSHVLGKDGSVKASFTIADHGASHEGAAVAHLQQNFDNYMGEGIDKGLEDELMSQRQGESGKKWRVERAGKTIGSYNSKDKADVKAMKHPLNKVVANEEAELEEGLSSMSDARIKYHATKDFPHGKYSSKEIKAEHKRRMKAVPNYHTVKPSMEEEAKNPYAVGMAAAMKATGDKPPLEKSTIVKAHKIAKGVMKENKFLTGVLKKLQEGRGRPPKEGSAAWHRQQAAKSSGKDGEETKALGVQLRKASSINAPVTFDDGKSHQIHPAHIDKFHDHMAARKTTQEKHDFQKRASKSHDAFKSAISEPLPNSKGGGSEVVKYRH